MHGLVLLKVRTSKEVAVRVVIFTQMEILHRREETKLPLLQEERQSMEEKHPSLSYHHLHLSNNRITKTIYFIIHQKSRIVKEEKLQFLIREQQMQEKEDKNQLSRDNYTFFNRNLTIYISFKSQYFICRIKLNSQFSL